MQPYAWAMLRDTPSWEQIEQTMVKLNSIGVYEFSDDNEAKLHNQSGVLIEYCTEDRIMEWRAENTSIVDRWVEIFKHMFKNHCKYDELSVMIEYVLCLPGTNSSVERLFSSVNVTWTDSKTRLTIETLKAILFVKCNSREDCVAFYRYLQSNSKLVDQIASKGKYERSVEDGETAEDVEMVTDESD